jgi:transmembrane sensor
MSERTPEEAARWFLRLQEPSASAETFLEWQRWLSAAPEHKSAFDEIETTLTVIDRVNISPPLSSVLEMAEDSYDGSVAVSEFLASARARARAAAAAASAAAGQGSVATRTIGGNSARTRFSTGLRYAAAAGVTAAVLAGGWMAFNSLNKSQHGDFAYSTAPGERKAFTLPDGSRVTLDADSALNVELGRGRRLLRLARGEAFFRVAKDAERPFVVSAGATRVRALGTEFNVRMGDHRTVIAVVEGAVQVAAPPATPTDSVAPAASTALASSAPSHGTNASPELTARVGAGQAVAYADDKGLEKLPEVEASLATTWLGGRRQYRKEPLKDVLADVDRYTGRQIEVADEATGALEFTGTLDVQNSDAWLRALSIALPVVVTQKPNGVMLVAFDSSARPTQTDK